MTAAPRRAHEHAAVETAGAKGGDASEPAALIDIFGDIGVGRHESLCDLAPDRGWFACGEEKAGAAGDGLARKPRAGGQTHWLPRQRETSIGEVDRFDPRRRRLQFRLSGIRVVLRRRHFVDARVARRGVAPVNRSKQRAEPLARCHHDLEDRCAMPGRDLGKAAIGDAGDSRVGRIDLDKGLRRMGGEARAFAGARHRVPLVAHAAGIQAQRVDRIRRRAQRRAVPAR